MNGTLRRSYTAPTLKVSMEMRVLNMKRTFFGYTGARCSRYTEMFRLLIVVSL